MLLSLASKTFFSESKNYINAFKVRSRLSDFFKHIHPDQMVQAPVSILPQRLKLKMKICVPLKTSIPISMPLTKKSPSKAKLSNFISVKRQIIRVVNFSPSTLNSRNSIPSRLE